MNRSSIWRIQCVTLNENGELYGDFPRLVYKFAGKQVSC